jgi:hypothetical protein
LLRYRGAAMAEFWRALKTLKALQAEAKSVEQPAASAHALQGSTRCSPLPLAAHAPNEPECRAERTAPPPPAQMAHRPTPDRPAARRSTNEPGTHAQPDEPERAAPRRLEYATGPSLPERMLHEPAAPWLPNEPESGGAGCAGVRTAAGRRLP